MDVFNCRPGRQRRESGNSHPVEGKQGDSYELNLGGLFMYVCWNKDMDCSMDIYSFWFVTECERLKTLRVKGEEKEKRRGERACGSENSQIEYIY